MQTIFDQAQKYLYLAIGFLMGCFGLIFSLNIGNFLPISRLFGRLIMWALGTGVISVNITFFSLQITRYLYLKHAYIFEIFDEQQILKFMKSFIIPLIIICLIIESFTNGKEMETVLFRALTGIHVENKNHVPTTFAGFFVINIISILIIQRLLNNQNTTKLNYDLVNFNRKSLGAFLIILTVFVIVIHLNVLRRASVITDVLLGGFFITNIINLGLFGQFYVSKRRWKFLTRKMKI